MNGLNLIQKAARLTFSEVLLLFRVALLASLLRVLVWVLPFRTFLDRLVPVRSVLPEGEGEVDRFVWATLVVGHRLPWTRDCLVQALALRWFLIRHGHEARLRLGVSPGAKGKLRAHAWVEHGGKVLIGEAERRQFVALPPLQN